MRIINVVLFVRLICLMNVVCFTTSCRKADIQNISFEELSAVNNEVNVLDFRDSSINDHDMIQKAIDYAKSNSIYHVFIPDGTYMISATSATGQAGLVLRDSIALRLGNNAILKAISNGSGAYAIVKIHNVRNVSISGGKIVGDRLTHIGTFGEWGMGIEIRNSTWINLNNLTVKECWGDGIYIAGGATHVTLDSIFADNNRRQGMSVINAKELLVTNSEFNNTNGVAPESGIDLEPNAGDSISGVRIVNCAFRNNNGLGLHMYGNFGPVTDISIENCQMTNNPIGLSLRYQGVRDVEIKDVTISQSASEGFRVFDGSYDISASNVKIYQSPMTAIRFQNSRDITLVGAELDSFSVGMNVVNVGQLLVKNTSLKAKLSTASGILLNNSDTLLFDNVDLIGGKDGLRTSGVNYLRFLNGSISDFLEYGCFLGNTHFSLFEGNIISNNRKTPFYFTSSHDNEFKNNELLNNCFLINNNYSQFNLEGASKRNVFQSNIARTSSYANKPKYVIRLSSSTQGNQVFGNTFEPGSYVTAGAIDETGGLNSIF
ncbi:right-handed parallel beta-helix repeat-containing protein [Pedobacter sp. ASV1-7]|uniref:right-handed parallel beta-helix repeat-containing protein n=1 Tax=Pedobacter sp. ASV1-7 TaxID=3145237 RepID=UPI0032E933A1